MKLAAIILAAGYSSRMGGFKPLMDLSGQSLLARCSGVFQQAGITAVTIVSGHRHKEVEAEAARLGLGYIYNPDYDRGMYESVRTAAAWLTDIDGFFMQPVDIPLVRPSTITALADTFDGQSVLYPTFEGLRGHPPLIPTRCIPAILAHDGGGGLKALLEKQKNRNIAVWDRGILMDGDTPEDFAALGLRAERLAIGDRAEALALAILTMPRRGIEHGLAVAEAAVALGRELNDHGYRLNLDILYNAALLHDMAKGAPHHELRAGEMLTDLGLDNLAPVAAAHRDAAPPPSGLLSEKEVVCLADKLVRGSRRVAIGHRFAEKLELYDGDDEACQAIRRRLATALALQAMVEATAGKSVDTLLSPEDG